MIAVLISLLSVPAGACDGPPPMGIVGTLPSAGQEDVPLDARLVVELSGDGATSWFDARILHAETETEVETSRWYVQQQAGAPDLLRAFVAVQPKVPLVKGGAYVFRIEANSSHPDHGTDAAPSLDVAFVAADVARSEPDGLPTVEVLAVEELTGASECDYPVPWVATLRVEPAGADGGGLGMLHVYEVERDYDTQPANPHRSWLLGTRTEGFEEAMVMNGEGEHPGCFIAFQEDSWGTWHGPSDVHCLGDEDEPVDTGEPWEPVPDPTLPTPEFPRGGAGCDAAGGGAGMLALVVSFLGIRRRRR